MSFEITVKRTNEKPPLTAEDLERVVKDDNSLSDETGLLVWTDPASGQKRHINIALESGELPTDDTRGDDESIDRFLDKLRNIAGILDARVVGEGEDITEATPVRPRRSGGCLSAIVFLAAPGAVILFLLLKWR